MLLGGAARIAPLRIAEKSAPKFAERIVFTERCARCLFPAELCSSRDVHYHWSKSFSQTGKLGQTLSAIDLYRLATVRGLYPDRYQQIDRKEHRPGTAKK